MILTLNHVIAGYEGADILNDVTLSIKQGSLTCIVGPNGAGKSTLLRVISGYLKPRRGTILFNGHSIAGVSPHQLLALGIRLVESQSLFLDMTVEENVRLGGYLLKDQVAVNQRFSAIEAQFPLIKERAREKAGSLSGGQQRIVEFARSLMLDPMLLLLDEPSVGLDPKALQQMLIAIKRVNSQGKTILVVEQNVQAGFSIATHGVMMEGGRVHLEGSPQQLLAHPDLTNLFFKGGSEHVSPVTSSPVRQTRLLPENSTPVRQTRLLPENTIDETMTQMGSDRASRSGTSPSPLVLLSTMVGDTFHVTQREMQALHHLLSLACGSFLLPVPLPDKRSPLDLFSDDNFYLEFFDQYLWPLLNQISRYQAGLCLTVTQETLNVALRSAGTLALSPKELQKLWKATLERSMALLADKVGIPLLHIGKHVQVLQAQHSEEMLSSVDLLVEWPGAQNEEKYDLQKVFSDFLARISSMPTLSLPPSQTALRTWLREQDRALLQQLNPGAYELSIETASVTKRYTSEKLLARKRKKLLTQSRNQ